MVVNAAGAQQPQTVYFRIAPPQVPQGAHDVFSCFTINGHPVGFDDSKYAFSRCLRRSVIRYLCLISLQ